MGSSICKARRAALVAVVLVAVPAATRAQAAGDETPKRQAEAKLLSGVNLLKAGRYAEALERFQEAYALVPSPLILYDFGLAQLGLGQDAEALASFERFLSDAPDAPEDKRRKAAEHRDDLRARLAVETPPPPVVPIPPPSAPVVATAAPAPASQPVAVEVVRAPPAQARRHRPEVWALTAAAAGAVSLGAGLTFGVLASQAAGDVTADSQNRRVFMPASEAAGLRDQRLEVVFLSVGAVAVLAGLGIYAVLRHRESDRARPGSP